MTDDMGITRGEAVFLLGGLFLLAGLVGYLVTEVCLWAWPRVRKWWRP